MVALAGGNAHVLALALPTYQEPDTVLAAELKKCANCSSKIINVNIATASTTLAPQIASTLIANPDINYIYSGPGDFEPFEAEAIREARDVGKVHAFYADCQGPGTTSMATDKITSACLETGSGFIRVCIGGCDVATS